MDLPLFKNTNGYDRVATTDQSFKNYRAHPRCQGLSYQEDGCQFVRGKLDTGVGVGNWLWCKMQYHLRKAGKKSKRSMRVRVRQRFKQEGIVFTLDPCIIIGDAVRF
jgi:hypothetical protein